MAYSLSDSTDNIDDILFDYQKDWLLDESPVKVCEKSRRIGVTWAEALDAVLIAYADKTAGGSDYLYISTKRELAKEFIDTCAEWVDVLHPWEVFPVEEALIEDVDKAIHVFTIDFPSGYTIYALSSNPSNMRGMQGVVCIDEAAHQKNLGSQLKAAMAMLMWGAKVRIISTHDGESNEFNQLVKAVKAGTSKFSLHSYDIERAIAGGLYRRICYVNGLEWTPEKEGEWLAELVASYGDAAQEELYCCPSTSGTNYFNLAAVEAATSEDCSTVRLKCSQDFIEKPAEEQLSMVQEWVDSRVQPCINSLTPLSYQSYAGLDFARSHDLSVLSILVENYGGARWFPLVVEMRNVPYDCQALICRHIFSKLKRFKKAAFDATGNGAYLAEAMSIKFGSHRIDSVKFSEKEYLMRFPRYKAALQGGRVKIPADPDIINDHLTVELINGVPKVPTNREFVGADNLPRHGDAAVSLMLAFSATPDVGLKRVLQLGGSQSILTL